MDDVQRTELLAALEAATEKDQEERIDDALCFARDRGWINPTACRLAMRWTALGAFESAALTLVPEGWAWHVHSFNAAEVSREAPYEERTDITEITTKYGESATPALALCIAAIRARGEG